MHDLSLPPEDVSLAELSDRLRSGDPEAARLIFQRFARRLLGLARRRLNKTVRQKLDPEDVIQSVFRTFFFHQGEATWQFETWDSLWSMLAVITLRKCGHRIQHYQAARRDVQREVALGTGPAPEEPTGDWSAVARDPTPEEAAILTETVQQLMQALSPQERHILERSLRGLSNNQISADLGCTRRTVERALQRVRTILEQLRCYEPY
jgi:RNA polymerase sigma-70 factor (ECF subfamily)